MTKLLKFKEATTEIVKDFALFVVILEDRDGKQYRWASKWADLAEIFKNAPQLEEENEGKAYLEIAEASLSALATIINNVHLQDIHLAHPLIINRDRDKPYIRVKLETINEWLEQERAKPDYK